MKSTFCAASSRTSRRAFVFRRRRRTRCRVRIRARAGVGRAHAAAGREEASAAEAAGGLVFAESGTPHLRDRSPRDDGADAEVERAIEILDDGVAAVILRAIRRALLEAGVRVDVDERRHHRLAGEVDVRGARAAPSGRPAARRA